jgi:hypothetical protein
MQQPDNYTRAYFMSDSNLAVVGSCLQRTVRIVDVGTRAAVREVDVSLAVNAMYGSERLVCVRALLQKNALHPRAQPLCRSAAIASHSYVQSLRGHSSVPHVFATICKNSNAEFPSTLIEVDVSRRYDACGGGRDDGS